MLYVGIFVGLAIIFWNLDKITDLRYKFRSNAPKVYKSVNVHPFNVTVNYHVSSLLSYKFQKIIAISVTVVNKTADSLKNLKITALPGHKLINYEDLKKLDEEVYHLDHSSIAQFKPLEDEVEAMDIQSGYLLFETDKDVCDIDRLVVTYGDEAEEVTIRKEQIMEQTAVQLL